MWMENLHNFFWSGCIVHWPWGLRTLNFDPVTPVDSWNSQSTPTAIHHHQKVCPQTQSSLFTMAMSPPVTGGVNATSELSRPTSTSLPQSGTDLSDTDNLSCSCSRSILSQNSFTEGSELSFLVSASQSLNNVPHPHPFVDRLCRRLELSPNQSAELHGWGTLCS